MIGTSLLIGTIIGTCLMSFIWVVTSFVYWDWSIGFSWKAVRIWIMGCFVISSLVFANFIISGNF